MPLRALAVRVNINAAVTETGADVTKNVPTRVKRVQAVNAGTAQSVWMNPARHQSNITVNVITTVLLTLAIKAAGGYAAVKNIFCKMDNGKQMQVICWIGTVTFQVQVFLNVVQRLTLMRPLIALV